MQSLYAHGRLPSTRQAVFAVLSPTGRGWRCRSTVRGELQHDYVCDEDVDELVDWLQTDVLEGTLVTTFDREEARERLSTLLASEDGTSLFHGAANATAAPWSEGGVAERVLQHLERGW